MTGGMASEAAPLQTAAPSSHKFDPSLDHLCSADYQHVYEPAEDTFLFLDALHQERSFITSHLPRHPVCVEVGSGSGMVVSYLSALLGGRGLYWATDINAKAAQATRATMRRNGVVTGDVICCDLLSALLPRLLRRVDVLLFNPPYVPTPSSELRGEGIERSWAGGERGREVLDRLLSQLDAVLSPRGVFYCILLRDNDVDDVRRVMGEAGLDSRCLAKKRAGREELHVVKAWRTQSSGQVHS